jgi:uncharacterized protein GlcG (DUF336 family)
MEERQIMTRVSIALAFAAVVASGVARAQPAAPPAAPPPPPPYGMPINGDQAQQALTAAEAEARRNNWSLSFAVVDAYGNLVMYKRMPNTAPFTGDIAIKKAKTSAMFRAPSKMLADMAAQGGAGAALSQIIPDAIPAEGGVPIIVDGKLIGAIGASGAQGSQDAQAAARGAAAVR